VPESQEEDFEVVCNCFGVTDREIVKAIRENDLKTVEQVTYYTKAGGDAPSAIQRSKPSSGSQEGDGEGSASAQA